MAKVLILDRSRSVRNILRERLEYEGFATEAAEDAAAASSLCATTSFDLIISDTGKRVAGTDIPFIVLSADSSIDSAVEALRNGALDFLTKPVDMNRLMQSIHRTVVRDGEESPAPAVSPAAPASTAAAPAVRRPRRTTEGPCREIVGESAAIGRVKQMIAKVAPCDARVFITGENGTGKELVAHALHAGSSRASGPFVEVNCAAIPSELIESELFGHEKGAFTSAVKQRKGKFEQAEGGTIFLDEIGDMSLAAQAKVLRALQERKICRVGSDKDIDVNVRVIAATNKDLKEEIRKGNFREDLYHRIGVVIIRVPALRERAEDIPLLVDHFIRQLAAEYNMIPKDIDPRAIESLCHMPWTGNIRELRNVVERLMILSEERITAEDVRAYVNV